MDVMPDSILLTVFQSVNRETLCLGVRLTCRRWWCLTFDPDLWRHLSVPAHFSDRRLLLMLDPVHDFLEELDMGRCHSLTPSGLLMVAQFPFSNLKKLLVPISTLLPEDVYEAFAKSCPRLEEIENVRCAYRGDCNPLRCQGLLPDLTTIHDRPVASFGRVRIGTTSPYDAEKRGRWTSSLALVASLCDKIKHYRCNRGLDYLDDNGLEAVGSLFPDLSSLELRTCAVTDDAIGRFLGVTHPERLREITFDKPGPVTNKGLDLISGSCPNLNTVKLARCSKITNAGIGNLVRRCTGITDLQINNSPGYFEDSSPDRDASAKEDVTDESMQAIGANLPKLCFFRIYYSEVISHAGIAQVVDGCRWLRGLMLFQCAQICDKALATLKNCQFLRNLILVYCKSISPDGLIDFVLLSPSLNRLTFYTKNLNFCDDMTSLADTTYARLDSDSFRPNQVNHLALRGVGGGFLQLLTVLCPNLSNLDVRESSFVFEWSIISVVKLCESLRHLDVSSMADVSDKFLDAVCDHCGELRVLSLGSSVKSVTTDALAKVCASCQCLHCLEMDVYESDVDLQGLVASVRRSHGGRCCLYVEPEDDDLDEQQQPKDENEIVKPRYVELHFTPIIYLNSVQTLDETPTTDDND